MLSSFSFSDATVGYIFEGDVNEVTINRFIVQIEEKWETHDKINLYLEDNDIEHFTLGAIFKEIAFKYENADRFARIALVTDRRWIRACATVEGMFLSAEVRAFDVADRLEALSWVSQKRSMS